jgi:hypothetical protein
MSSRYVRTTVRNWLGLGSVPFYDTVNVEQDPTDRIWNSVDWGAGFRDRETFCGEVESGNFDVVFVGPPGIGDDELLEKAEAEIQVLMTRVDPSQKLSLLMFSAPQDFRTSQGKFCVSISVEYEYRA